MNARNEAQVTQVDDIRLTPILIIFHRRWPSLLVGLSLGVLIAIAYVLFASRSYESHSVVQIGRVHEVGPVENVDTLAVQLIDQYGPERRKADQDPAAYLKQVTKLPGQNTLRLVAVGPSPDTAKAFLVDVVTKLMASHERIYQQALDPLRQRLAGIDVQISLATTQITQFNELITRLKQLQPTQAALVAIERGRLYPELAQLERDRIALSQHIIKPFSSPSEIITTPAQPSSAVAPRKFIVIAAGMVLGVALGLLFVFVREFLGNIRTTSAPHTGRN